MKRLPSYQLWMLGIGLGAFIAILFAPQTSWTARWNIRSLFNGNPLLINACNFTANRPENSVAKYHPNDLQIQIANYVETTWTPEDPERLAATALFERCFPHSASGYAAVIRNLCRNGLHAENNATEQAFVDAQSPIIVKPLTSDQALQVQAIISAARKGESLDPDNAFFPIMLAAAEYAEQDDNAAVKEIEQAGRDHAWNEYMTDEIDGHIRTAELTFGGVNASGRIAIWGATLFPQYGPTRGAARMAHWQAVVDEQEGRVAEGLLIQHSLVKVGALMRADSQNYICSLVGMAIASLAITRPAEEPKIELPATAELTAENNNILWGKKVKAFVDYAASHGDDADAIWVPKELAVENRLRTNQSLLMGLVTFDLKILASESAWLGGTWLISLWSFISLLFLCFSVGYRIAVDIRTHNRLHLLRRVQIAAAILVSLVLLGALRIAFSNNPMSQVGASTGLSGAIFNIFTGRLDVPHTGVISGIYFAVVVAPFLLFGAYNVVAARLRKQSPATVLTEATWRVVVPTISVLLIAYAIATVGVARQAAIEQQEMQTELSMGEGQYAAMLAGEPWPGLVPEPDQPRNISGASTRKRLQL